MKSLLFFLSFISFIGIAQDRPTTLRCKDVSNDRVRKNCIIKEIQKYVDQYFDVSSVVAVAKKGRNKIYTQFKITNTAKLIEIQVKASAWELEKEAVRVLKAFPNLISRASIRVPSEDEVYNLLISFDTDTDMLRQSPQQQLTDMD